MGEFADYALDEVFEQEQYRAWDMPDNEPIDPHFKWDCHDLPSLEAYTRELSGMLDGAGGLFEKYQRFGSVVDRRIDKAKLKATAKKYLQAWSMRLGMAQQLAAGKALSTKQVAWMETNWKGGTVKFEMEVKTAPEKLVKLLIQRYELVKKLAED
jgi:hypothetical protein